MTISANQGSKVIVQEINLSQVITNASTSVVAQVIVSTQGRTTPIQFTNAQDYLAEYGPPNAAVSRDVYCGLDYFKEGQTLWGLRVPGANSLYAGVVLMGNVTTGEMQLVAVTNGVATPQTPNWSTLVDPITGFTPLALFYPNRGPGGYGDNYAINIVTANLTQPTLSSHSTSAATGGTMVAGTYQYQVSSLGSNGETLASNPQVIVIGGTAVTNSVTLYWPYQPNAIGYNVYGRTASGVGQLISVGQIAAANAITFPNDPSGTLYVSWTDTGALTPNTAKLPLTSPSQLPAPIQTFGINVYDQTQSLSYPVESFTCSFYENTDSTGVETELEQRINPFSLYIQVTSNIPALAPAVVSPPMNNVAQTAMAGGASGDPPLDTDIAAAWNTFANKQLYAVNILLNSGHASPTVQLAMDTLAQQRGDCVALLDVPSTSQQFQQAINYRRLQLNLNSTYSALFSPDVLEADTINGKQQYVPFSGWAAALCARTDRVANPSFSIAGLNRGIVNVLKTRYTYDQGQMDALFQAQVNYTQTFIGQGIALWEQQTLAAQMSALSWLSVRRIINVIKVALYQFLLYSLQEPNDDFLGRQIVASCSDYLQSIQNARGISQFTVISDSSNNTAQDFNSGIRNVTVIIVPVIPVHIINLQVVVSKQGVSFTEALSQVNPG